MRFSIFINCAAGLLAALVVSFAMIYIEHKNRELFSRLHDAQLFRDGLNEEWSQLQLELSTYASPTRVEMIARSKVGMRMPVPSEVAIVAP